MKTSMMERLFFLAVGLFVGILISMFLARGDCSGYGKGQETEGIFLYYDGTPTYWVTGE